MPEISADELTEFRAALMQIIKSQERQIDAEKRMLAMLEKRMGIRSVSGIVIENGDSVAGTVHPVHTTTT